MDYASEQEKVMTIGSDAVSTAAALLVDAPEPPRTPSAESKSPGFQDDVRQDDKSDRVRVMVRDTICTALAETTGYNAWRNWSMIYVQ